MKGPEVISFGGGRLWPGNLELTLLVARKDTRRHPRVGARWLLRYLEEDPAATVEEAAPAASSLIALTGAGYQ